MCVASKVKSDAVSEESFSTGAAFEDLEDSTEPTDSEVFDEYFANQYDPLVD